MQVPIFTLKRTGFAFLLIAALFAALISGCTVQPGQAEMSDMKLAPLASMPAKVQQAPVSVQQAYQFAVANPEILTQIPCYCGCGSMGHTSNYACYVSGEDADGAPTFDNHALGCSICVDITQDTMRLMGEGKNVTEIRAYVDGTYAKYGPSNIP